VENQSRLSADGTGFVTTSDAAPFRYLSHAGKVV